jgi:DNA-binding transcriptional ArsR family regulator
LNQIMGTEANVRILRALCERRAPISAAELARQAHLQRSTVSRALQSLEESQVIDLVGVAPRAQAALRDGVLGRAIRQLFDVERERFDALLDGLKQAANKTAPPPYAVWVGGNVARGVDRPGESITVFLLDTPDRVALTAQRLRADMERVERKLDLTLDVQELTLADLAADAVSDGELRSAIVVVGVPPLGLRARALEGAPKARKRGRIQSHADHDSQLLTRAQSVAAVIGKDPAVIDRAREYIEKRWRDASSGERNELAEWRRILKTASPASVRKILTGSDARSIRLRQTMPFLDVVRHR